MQMKESMSLVNLNQYQKSKKKENEMAIKCENKWNLQHLHCDVIYNICDRKPMIT